MATRIENACNGCDTCLGCGRKGDYQVFYCDDCWTLIEEKVYFQDEQDFCEACILENIPHEENMVFDCDRCGKHFEERTMWLLNGKDLCEDCVLQEVPQENVEDCFEKESYFDD
ncbi:MAG: hypothetical protein K2J71_06095 [Oscillospiraceae bacterium]|nr:hypothetical protein [Oscillospiraceae bacterium]